MNLQYAVTSASMLLNIPVALACVTLVHWLISKTEDRISKYHHGRKTDQPGPAGSLDASAKPAGDAHKRRRAPEHAWKSRVKAAVAEHAWETLCNSIVQEVLPKPTFCGSAYCIQSGIRGFSKFTPGLQSGIAALTPSDQQQWYLRSCLRAMMPQIINPLISRVSEGVQTAALTLDRAIKRQPVAFVSRLCWAIRSLLNDRHGMAVASACFISQAA